MSLLLYANGTLPIIKDTVGSQAHIEFVKWENSALSLVIYTIVAYAFIVIFRMIITSPFHIYREQEKKKAFLQNKIINRKARYAALKKLWDLREYGSDLRNRANDVTSEENWKPWHAEYDKWRDDFLREAKAVSINLKNWNAIVQTMDTSKMPPLISPYKTNGLFISNYMVICENLNRLDHYLMNELFLEQQEVYVTR